MAARAAPLVVLPRPGVSDSSETKPTISAPSEAAMTSTFGALLPACQYITSSRGRAAYYLYPPSAPTPSSTLQVLMVHGIQTPALGLHPLTEALRTRFPTAQIALVDLWGHGLSDTPQVPHTPALFYELLDSVLAELGWARPHLLGFSFGGSTVVGYVASSEERAASIASLTLVAPAGLLRVADFEENVRHDYLDPGACDEQGARNWILAFLEGGRLSVPDDWKERVGNGEVVAEAVRDWEMRVHKGHEGSIIAIFRDGGVFDNHAAFVKVAERGIPCLSVVGEVDFVCSADALRQVGLSNVHVVPQAGHSLVRERVPEVAQCIEEFWKQF